jgi:hypothetical protein
VPQTYREKLYPLCERMGGLAFQMMDQCELTVTKHGMTDPKILVLALLSRTLSNLKGVALLVQHGLVVEARVLARCCYENMFMVGGLHAKGVEFAGQMIEDDQAGRKGRLRFAFETEPILKSLSAETQEAVKRRHEAFMDAPKVGFLRPKEASEVGELKDTYAVYSQFSGDAAHPTITALARHWGEADPKTAFFDAAPAARDRELDETLHLACIALITIMVLVNEMHGYTEAGKQLPALNRDLKALQAERWGQGEIGEGMEIRTEKPAS